MLCLCIPPYKGNSNKILLQGKKGIVLEIVVDCHLSSWCFILYEILKVNFGHLKKLSISPVPLFFTHWRQTEKK